MATTRASDDGRITWVHGADDGGPGELIGVLEVRADGAARAAFAERAEVDGRAHILLARTAWGRKDALETRWWSLVLDRAHRRATLVRNGSCGDAVTPDDVPRITAALESLGLADERTMIAVDAGRPAFPWMPPRKGA